MGSDEELPYEKDNKWHIEFRLFPGKYQYKLVTDGREISDPFNPDSMSNGLGGYNSLLTVGTLNSPKLPNLFTLKEISGKQIRIGHTNKADTFLCFGRIMCWIKGSGGAIRLVSLLISRIKPEILHEAISGFGQ